MIDGIWWLVILLVVIGVLWLIAHRRGDKNSVKNQTNSSSTQKTPANDALQKTAVLLKEHFSDYRVTRRANHLMISKQDKKIAMITIDKNIAVGQRRLGDVPIINYHRIPSRAQLSANLQDTQQS